MDISTPPIQHPPSPSYWSSSSSLESMNDSSRKVQIEPLADFDFKATSWNTGLKPSFDYELELLKEKNKEVKRLNEKFYMLKGEPIWLLRHIEALREEYAKYGWEHDVVIPEECLHRLYHSPIGGYLIYTRDKKGRKGKTTKEYFPVPLSNGAKWGDWRPMDDEGRPPTKYSLEDLLEKDRREKVERDEELRIWLKQQADKEYADSEEEVNEDEIEEYPLDEEEYGEYALDEEDIDEYPNEDLDENINSSGSRGSGSGSGSGSSGESSIHNDSTRPTTSASHRSIKLTAGDYAPDRAFRPRKVSSTSVLSDALNETSYSKAGTSSKRKPVAGSSHKGGNRLSVDSEDDKGDADMDELMETVEEDVDEDDDEDVDIKMEEDEDDYDRSPTPQPISSSRSRSRSALSSDRADDEEDKDDVEINMEAEEEVLGGDNRGDGEDSDRSPTPTPIPRNQNRSRVIHSSDPEDEEDEEEEEEEEEDPPHISKSHKATRGRVVIVIDISDSESASVGNQAGDDELPGFNTKSAYSKHTRGAVIEISDEDDDEEQKYVPPETGVKGQLLRGTGLYRGDAEDQKVDLGDEGDYGYGEMDYDVEDYEAHRDGAAHDDHHFADEHGDEQEDFPNDHEYSASPEGATQGHATPAGEINDYGTRTDRAAGVGDFMADTHGGGGGQTADEILDEEWFNESGFCNFCKLHQYECVCTAGGERNPMIIDSDDDEDYVV